MGEDWFAGNGGGKPVDVLALLDSQGWEHLKACVSAGALLSLGLTSDGGALGVTVTVDGRWRREYFRDADALEAWAAGASEAVDLAVASASASSVPRSRTRGRRAP